MLAIRMQRTGRKGHAQFRVIVQDSRRTPTSGKVVANLGHYNPHTKDSVIDKEKATYYLSNGAQPSERVAGLLKSEGVKLPDWVKTTDKKDRTTRNPDKLRKNRPAEPETPKAEVADTVEEPVVAEEVAEEVSVETPEAEVSNTTVTEEATEEKPAESETKEA